MATTPTTKDGRALSPGGATVVLFPGGGWCTGIGGSAGMEGLRRGVNIFIYPALDYQGSGSHRATGLGFEQIHVAESTAIRT